MVTANVGATFKSGEKAPVAGTYEYVNHRRELPAGVAGCKAEAKDNSVKIAAGAELPNHVCLRSVIWKLSKVG